jgi:5-formyltetrahydrofolate cyclo-ligase
MMRQDDVRALVTASGSIPWPGKRELRQAARDAPDPTPAPTRAAAALAIADAVDREVLAPLPHGAIVALYAPVASEVDTRPIALHALARHLRVAYPRVVGPRRLTFALATPDELEAGMFRIPEPRADAAPAAPAEIAAFVVPGIAFDRAGARIGWGHGYYDATLAGAPHALRAGVAFESQILAHVPVDPNDAPVHLIITERGVHRCAPVPGAP